MCVLGQFSGTFWSNDIVCYKSSIIDILLLNDCCTLIANIIFVDIELHNATIARKRCGTLILDIIFV